MDTDSSRSEYARATADLRGTVRWIASAGAAIATVVVTGLSLRDLAVRQLSRAEVIFAAVSVCVAVGLSVALVWAASQVLAIERLSLNDLADREMQMADVTKRPRLERVQDDVVQYLLDRKTDLLLGAESVTAFYISCTSGRRGAKGVVPQKEEVAASVRRVEDAAEYVVARRNFDRLRRNIAIATPVFLAAVLALLFLVSPRPRGPAVTEPVPVDIHVVNFRDAGVPSNCPSRLIGVAVAGTLDRPTVVTLATRGCQPLRIEDGRGILAIPVGTHGES